MTTQDSSTLRYPKGWFALTTVYSFTGLAILASIIFSLLLFLSIDDNPLMKWLFGGLAIIFELGKFYVWYEYGERKARRDLSGAFWSLLFYSVLAAISIGGSIGGINSATNTVLSQQARHERELARFDEQIASIERQIQLNEEAARKYIELERISSGVSSLQHANTKLRLQQDELRQQRDAKPVNEQSSMLGLMSSLADGVGMSISQVQFLLVCFLSVLLDVFGAFFVSLIGEENRFRRMWRWQQDQARREAQAALAMAAQPEPIMPPEPAPEVLAQVRGALMSGELKCSKRSVAQALSLSLEEVDRVFHHLLSQGVLGQGSNRHYYLNPALEQQPG
ncbi:Preprotein translocase subunit SecY [Aeromonas veronii]|uniref:Preprotein translocase subunit SecY n=1 Tax=Aeromonas veronii TaxID=654 RepID=UPI00111731F1|nr:Preprotein translocase subunit SecY [Aeromonas veronii]MCF5878685.1 Preprotein translocase subunit SecY [Aeromonas veronii]WLD19889.1 Preprotein translocase subunit SecY [Aeromonas veronii]HDO1320536.1 Preprotein translocase subunit SecY [Aeromonas veronii]